MKETDLHSERLHAITEKHRIQKDIRQKKQELDQEKLKLQHLKKKCLREQWLLRDSASNSTAEPAQQQRLLCDQQNTRALQLSIHRIETEVESLEREESRISKKESIILNRLKAIEKNPGDIFKEAQESSGPEALQVTTVTPDVSECFSPPANENYEPNTASKTLFPMEVNVSKNLLTGKSSILSTATVPAEEINQHPGLKVYDDGRKFYALNPQEGSHNQSCMSELSANEVEHSLKSSTAHYQVNHPNSHQNYSRREQQFFTNHHDERGEKLDLRIQQGCYDNSQCKYVSYRENWQRRPVGYCGHLTSQNRWQENKNNQSNLRESNYGNQKNCHCSPYQLSLCDTAEDGPGSHHTGSIFRSNSVVYSGRANDCLLPRSHDQAAVSANQPQLCYTPANYIPLNDYISVDEEELYCYSPPIYQGHDGKPPIAMYSDLHRSDTVPSPLYTDDTPYTILDTMDKSEPITAIFMGFQTAQNDSGQGQEFEGSLKAEIVVIEENQYNADENSPKEKKNYVQHGGVNCPAGSSTNVNWKRSEGVGDRQTARGSPGIIKIPKKSKPCCTLC